MAFAAPPVRVSQVSTALAANRLGAADIVFFNLSAAAPLMVVAGVIPTAFAATGVTGLPVAFIAVGGVLAVFAVGLVAMARRVTNAGALYAYVTHGLGRAAGVGSAWVALLAYNCLQVGLYGIVGAATGPLLAQWFGVDPPWWAIALAAWVLVAVLGTLRVDLNGKVLAVLMMAEATIIVIFDVANLAHPAVGGMTIGTLSPTNLIGPGVGALVVIGFLGSVGFENALVYAEESRDRDRTVPRATYASIVVIAVLYTLSSWAYAVTTGPTRIVAEASDQGPELLFNLSAQHLGATAATIGHALFATSVIAAMISFHNTTARYAFALGREGVLPTWFGRTNAFGAPKAGSLLQTVIALAVIVTYAGGGWDPVTHLFYWAGAVGGLGVLLLIAITSIAIVVFFARHRLDESVWRAHIAPGTAMLIMLGVAYLAVTNFATVLGPAPTWLPTAVPAAFAAVALFGAGYALALKAAGSPVYPLIGLGARSAVVAAGAGDGVPRPRMASTNVRQGAWR